MRKAEEFKIEDLREVARWFFDEQLPKTEITERLQSRTDKKIDKRKVDQMLEQAKRRRVVVIDYPEVISREQQFENDLMRRFPHLRRVVVVPFRDGEKYSDLLARWGREAARYFDELVCAGHPKGRPLHVGISGGETLLSFVNAVESKSRRHVHVHTTALIGRGQLPEGASHVDPIVNATILWSKCGREPGHCHYATVLPYDGVKRDAIEIELKRLSKLQPIQDVLAEMHKISVVFAGLGVVQPDYVQDPHSVNQLTIAGLLEHVVPPKTLAAEEALGDLSYCLFDAKGAGRPKWEFFLTAGYGDPNLSGLAFFQKMADMASSKRVVVIAGSRKRRVLMAALTAKLFNVWITDDRSAEWVLSQ